jgi:hypothetical protein
MSERTVRHWLQQQRAPDVRPRRKSQSSFDTYAPYVLERWNSGCRNGAQLWREIAAASAILAPNAWSPTFCKRVI